MGCAEAKPQVNRVVTGGKPQDGPAALLLVWEVASEVGAGAKPRPPMSASALRTEKSLLWVRPLGWGVVGEAGLLI